jgi:hypothetical protein
VRRGDRPNILFFPVNNLGFDELSCYSGGPFRGTTTRRVDAVVAKGFRLTNMTTEAWFASCGRYEASCQTESAGRALGKAASEIGAETHDGAFRGLVRMRRRQRQGRSSRQCSKRRREKGDQTRRMARLSDGRPAHGGSEPEALAEPSGAA